jgi:hypothetical protein
MPTVADYVVLTDAPFTLPPQIPPSDKHLQFDAPGVSRSSQAILAYRVDPSIGSGTVTLRMRLNNVPYEQVFNTAPQRSWHEVFPAGTLRETGNELVVSVPSTSGGGTIAVSDIVVHFQVNTGPVVAGGTSPAS